MNIAIYSREHPGVPSKSIDELFKMKEWADKEGHAVIQTFVETAASIVEGRRPVRQEMIELALSREHPFDGILVYQYSRFSRDNIERAMTQRELETANVQVISMVQPFIDNKIYMLENLPQIIEEFHNLQNSEYTIRCQQKNARNGFFNGSRPPFGYMSMQTDVPASSGFKKRLVINAEEAEVVRKIFSLATEGDSRTQIDTRKIAEVLNQQGFSLRGRPWYWQRVHKILNNKAYIGRYITFRRHARTKRIRPESEWIVAEIPAIIDKEQFAKAQQRLQKRGFHKREAKPQLPEPYLRLVKMKWEASRRPNQQSCARVPSNRPKGRLDD